MAFYMMDSFKVFKKTQNRFTPKLLDPQLGMVPFLSYESGKGESLNSQQTTNSSPFHHPAKRKTSYLYFWYY
jgi:hypothetical protein